MDVKLEIAKNIIKSGGIVVYPTDTAYAIGCIYDNKSALKKIMQLKGRTDAKFTIIASSLYQVEKYFKLNKCQRKLAQKYWPGPLSIVVSAHYAVRVPQQVEARSLARAAGKPIIATSFNKTGSSAIYNLSKVDVNMLKDVPSVNVGSLKKIQPSTVIECKEEKVIIHRAGSIKIQK
ncbi:MAG: L-threonylcarbamoyladenylate synthase [bacterium]|nr:L-threonylcarbamoyladenylate synthase [bacterium]